jgi:hypothetical protein
VPGEGGKGEGANGKKTGGLRKQRGEGKDW